MNIVIDSGNTAVKAGLFADGQLKNAYYSLTTAQITDIIKQHTIKQGLICSVNEDPRLLKQQLMEHIRTVFILDHQLPVPLVNDYQTPQTLGKDRLAAVAGAKGLFPDNNCLVLDMGTCITYDFIRADGHYLGGSISPGLHMRFKALHTFTAKLPLLEPEPEAALIGRNSHDAILSGVINGLTIEIEGIIEKYQNLFPQLHVIFCGGDAFYFESKIKQRIFVIPELVLIGLNRILEYNVSKA